MANLSFLKQFKKDVGGKHINLELLEPSFWLDFGNYIINKVMSGKYCLGLPQGRIAALAGPSASGKSFVASNVAKCALDAGIGVLYIDTENAIDKGHFESIGIDIEHPLLQYADCSTISDCVFIVNNFIKNYKAHEETQPFIIIIDSLDMLQTDGDAEKYAKAAEIGGDQGQWAKQCKKMLSTFVQDIKRVPMAMLVTKQVYVNQDQYTKLQEPYKFTDGLKFAFSQICVVSRLLLKTESNADKKAKEAAGEKTKKVVGEGSSFKHNGITLQVYGFKTRFTQPFQKCVIEVPYTTGMDRYSGVLEAAVACGVIKQAGSWYTHNDTKFQKKTGWINNTEFKEIILNELIKREDVLLDVEIEGAVEDLGNEKPEDTVKRRQSRLVKETVED